MELKPVQEYAGANYPTLEEYFADRTPSKMSKTLILSLANFRCFRHNALYYKGLRSLYLTTNIRL